MRAVCVLRTGRNSAQCSHVMYLSHSTNSLCFRRSRDRVRGAATRCSVTSHAGGGIIPTLAEGLCSPGGCKHSILHVETVRTSGVLGLNGICHVRGGRESASLSGPQPAHCARAGHPCLPPSFDDHGSAALQPADDVGSNSSCVPEGSRAPAPRLGGTLGCQSTAFCHCLASLADVPPPPPPPPGDSLTLHIRPSCGCGGVLRLYVAALHCDIVAYYYPPAGFFSSAVAEGVWGCTCTRDAGISQPLVP